MIRVNCNLNWYHQCIEAQATIERAVGRKVTSTEWQKYAFAALIMTQPEVFANNAVVQDSLLWCFRKFRGDSVGNFNHTDKLATVALWKTMGEGYLMGQRVSALGKDWLYQLHHLLETFGDTWLINDPTNIYQGRKIHDWTHLEEQVKATCRSVPYFGWANEIDLEGKLEQLITKTIEGLTCNSTNS